MNLVKRQLVSWHIIIFISGLASGILIYKLTIVNASNEKNPRTLEYKILETSDKNLKELNESARRGGWEAISISSSPNKEFYLLLRRELIERTREQ